MRRCPFILCVPLGLVCFWPSHRGMQIVIMNVSNVVGRLSPGPLAHRLGVINMIAASAGCSAILILCMIALKSVVSVALIGVLCGFFSGVCQWPSLSSLYFG